MAQNNGAPGGISGMGLFCEGIGTLGGVPGLSANGFNRIYMQPLTSNATWSPLEYANAITIGIGGNGLTSAGWWVYNPVWSRYQPPGSTGFSNTYYLSSASSTDLSSAPPPTATRSLILARSWRRQWMQAARAWA